MKSCWRYKKNIFVDIPCGRTDTNKEQSCSVDTSLTGYLALWTTVKWQGGCVYNNIGIIIADLSKYCWRWWYVVPCFMSCQGEPWSIIIQPCTLLSVMNSKHSFMVQWQLNLITEPWRMTLSAQGCVVHHARSKRLALLFWILFLWFSL